MILIDWISKGMQMDKDDSCYGNCLDKCHAEVVSGIPCNKELDRQEDLRASEDDGPLANQVDMNEDKPWWHYANLEAEQQAKDYYENNLRWNVKHLYSLERSKEGTLRGYHHSPECPCKATERPLSPFEQVTKEITLLHLKKSLDYGTTDDPFANIRGTEDFGIPPFVGAIIRAADKVVRLKQFVKNGKLVNESVEDSLLDLATYAIIALVMYRENNA